MFTLIVMIIVIFLVTRTDFSSLGKSLEKSLRFVFPSEITGKGVYGRVSIFILPRCNFNVNNGWNFFSLCADTFNKSINYTFGNTSYRYVLRWNTTRMEWDIYSPRAVENPFDNFTINDSYFVLMYSPHVVFFVGNESDDMNITMIEGWNAPSWPYLFDTNVTKYLNETRHRYMMKWNNSAQEFMIYSPRAVDKPFTKIFKAEGQMLYAYSNHTLEYNKTYLMDP